MNKLLTSAVIGLGSICCSQAQFLRFDINVNRTFGLTSPTASQYLSGSTSITFQDGVIILSPCVFHPSATIVPPITNPPLCPLGTTARLIQGDINGDGITDLAAFWPVADITPNSIMEPFLPNSVRLVAAPPSSLSRPSGDFNDSSVATFYNVLTPVITRNDVALYRFLKTYSGLALPNAYQSHANEWVPGIYIYNVPAKGRPNIFQSPRLTITGMVEANGYRKGLRGFGLSTTMWSNGALEVDPRLITTLRWTGNTVSNTVSSDIIEFSIADSNGVILYPIPNTPYRLDSPYLTSLSIVPYTFTKGQVGISTIRFSRSLNTSAVSTDTSTRTWTWGTRFIDTYFAHAQYEFTLANTSTAPITGIKVAGAPASLRQPSADYDGDGISNIMEFAFSQDDGDDTNNTLEWTSFHNTPANQPSAATLATFQLTAPVTAPPVFLDTATAGVPNTPLVTSKRRNVGAAVTYGYEVNYDAANPNSRWVKLAAPAPGQTLVLKDKTAAKISGDPNFTWTIIDTFDTVLPAPGTTGATSIQASIALPTTVRVRSTAAVTKGY